MDVPAGARTSLGRYELTQRFATSRLAELYLARDGRGQRDDLVVVKRMLPHLVHDAALVEGFLSEARAAAALDHVNIVRIDKIDARDCYYAMEYVPGTDLQQLAQALANLGWVMSLECAVAIAIELCAGLGFVHEQIGIDGEPLVHRDVAPSNVLLSYDGAVKLADFGRMMDRRPGGALPEATIGYMSPEQHLGEPVDRRSDLFSLGIILYEMTTGLRLFAPEQPDHEVIERTVRGRFAPPSRHRNDFPGALDAIVVRALDRDPARRYQSAYDMQRDLETFLWAKRPTMSAAAIGELVALALPVGSARRIPAARPAQPAARPPTAVVPIEPRRPIAVGSTPPPMRATAPRLPDPAGWLRRRWKLVAATGLIAWSLARPISITGLTPAAEPARTTALPQPSTRLPRALVPSITPPAPVVVGPPGAAASAIPRRSRTAAPGAPDADAETRRRPTRSSSKHKPATPATARGHGWTPDSPFLPVRPK